MLVPCMHVHGMIRGQLCICVIICHNMAMTLLFFIDSAFPILTTNSKKTTLSRRHSFTIIFCLYLSHMFSAWVSFPLLLLLSVLGGSGVARVFKWGADIKKGHMCACVPFLRVHE